MTKKIMAVFLMCIVAVAAVDEEEVTAKLKPVAAVDEEEVTAKLKHLNNNWATLEANFWACYEPCKKECIDKGNDQTSCDDECDKDCSEKELEKLFKNIPPSEPIHN